MRSVVPKPRAALVGVLVALACAACEPPRPPKQPNDPPRNVLLISIDTLRADRCGFLGCAKPTTPFLDELAARGCVFEHHFANSNNTLTSHTSILTGLVPATHGVADNGKPDGRTLLRQGFTTLAEEFKQAGYATASFTTHPTWLARTFGLDQGFDVVESDWIGARESCAKFLDWYDEMEPDRMFAFLHFYDVHSDNATKQSKLPYCSTPELMTRFAGPPPAGFDGCSHTLPDCCASTWLIAVAQGQDKLSEEDVRYTSGLYDAGLAKLDQDLRDFFAELDDRGMLDDTLIVLTSDHGEEFMEHGHMLHGSFYDEIMHVPLLVVLPRGVAPSQARVQAVTRSIDIAPTVLDLCGLAPIGHGKSLAQCLRQGVMPQHPDVMFGLATLRSRDKFSTFKYANLGKEIVFYDLDADPGEHVNLWADPTFHERFPKRIEKIEQRVQDMRIEAAFKSSQVPWGDKKPVVDPDAERRLRELGYTGN